MKTIINYKTLGKKIQFKRKNLNLTQENMAEKLDVSVGYISQIERGISKISLDMLAKVSNLLECDIAEFVTINNYKYETSYNNDFFNIYMQLDKHEKIILIKLIYTYIENRK